MRLKVELDDDAVILTTLPGLPSLSRYQTMSSTPTSLRDAIEAFRPSAGGPVPTDPWTVQYWDMAGAHVTFLNALLGIYEVR